MGAGGFGREVYLWVKDSFNFSKYKIKGFLSNNKNDLDNFDIKVRIIGDPDYYEIKENDRFIFAIGDIDTKKRIVTNLKKKGAEFINFIHPTAKIRERVKMGVGNIFCPYSGANPDVIIGDFVIVNCYSGFADGIYGKDGVIRDYER